MECNFCDDRVDTALVIIVLSLSDTKRVGIECREVVGEQDEASKGPSTFDYNNVEAAEADKPSTEPQSIDVALAHNPNDYSNYGTNQGAASAREGGCV